MHADLPDKEKELRWTFKSIGAQMQICEGKNVFYHV